MHWDLQTLAGRIRAELSRGDTPARREIVATLLADALTDDAFVQSQFAGPPSERRVLFEDPQLGFCLVAHEYGGAREGGPHDHGSTWAIYGQAAGETVMSDFEVVTPASATHCARVRRVRSYPMRPGDVHLYNEGDVHAPSRQASIRLLRVEGADMDGMPRTPYERIDDAAAG